MSTVGSIGSVGPAGSVLAGSPAGVLMLTTRMLTGTFPLCLVPLGRTRKVDNCTQNSEIRRHVALGRQEMSKDETNLRVSTHRFSSLLGSAVLGFEMGSEGFTVFQFFAAQFTFQACLFWILFHSFSPKMQSEVTHNQVSACNGWWEK